MHMIKTHKNLLVILSLDRNVTSWSNPGIICGCKKMSKPQEQPDLKKFNQKVQVYNFYTAAPFLHSQQLFKLSWIFIPTSSSTNAAGIVSQNLPSNPNYSGMKSLQSTEMSLCTQHLRPKRPFSCERYYVLIRLLWDFPKSSFSQNFS